MQIAYRCSKDKLREVMSQFSKWQVVGSRQQTESVLLNSKG